MRPCPHPEKASKPRKKIRRLTPYTAADFDAEFPNDDTCLEYIRERRWTAAVTHCVKCGHRWKHHRAAGRTADACAVERVEKVEGRDAHKLKLTMKSGQVRHRWVDAVSFLDVKVGGTPKRMDAKMRPVEVYYRDYRIVNGLMFSLCS